MFGLCWFSKNKRNFWNNNNINQLACCKLIFNEKKEFLLWISNKYNFKYRDPYNILWNPLKKVDYYLDLY
jgi:hypothetical protein